LLQKLTARTVCLPHLPLRHGAELRRRHASERMGMILQAGWSAFAWKHWRLAAAASGRAAGPAAAAAHYELVPQEGRCGDDGSDFGSDSDPQLAEEGGWRDGPAGTAAAAAAAKEPAQRRAVDVM